MSRSQIACRKCGQPLAIRHHSGRVMIRLEAIQDQALVKGGTELTCRCGAVRFIRIEPPEPESQAA